MQKWWSVLFGVVLLASLGLFVVAPFVGWWLPRTVSSYGPGIYLLFYLILAVTGFFFVLTEGLLVYSLWRFAAVDGRKAEYTHGNHRLEVLWTAVPAVLLLLLGFSQIPIWHTAKKAFAAVPTWNQIMVALRPTGDDIQVMEVSARQFEWRVRYPSAQRLQGPSEVDAFLNEARSARGQADDVRLVNEIHVWKGAKVLVALKTRDVLHSFFLPNIPTKQDAVPGKTIMVWFDALEANTRRVGDRWEDGWRYDTGAKDWVKDKAHVWELACAELCGWGHYKMRGKFYVHESKEDFLAWLQDAARRQNSTDPGDKGPAPAAR